MVKVYINNDNLMKVINIMLYIIDNEKYKVLLYVR